MRRTRFEVFLGRDEQWYWRLKARNGQVVAQSEGYKRKSNAWKGAWACRSNVLAVEGIYEVKA